MPRHRPKDRIAKEKNEREIRRRERWVIQQAKRLELMPTEVRSAAILPPECHTAEQVARHDSPALLDGRVWVFIPIRHYLRQWSKQGWEMRARLAYRIHTQTFSIPPGKEVHHRNGDKGDDRPDNLQLVNKRRHAQHHAIKRHAAKVSTLNGPPAQILKAYENGDERLPRLPASDLARMKATAQASHLHWGILLAGELAARQGMDVNGLARLLQSSN